ncbi:MAG: hypothetical protein U1E93_02940 [Alphaproteobacteria bacterium]
MRAFTRTSFSATLWRSHIFGGAIDPVPIGRVAARGIEILAGKARLARLTTGSPYSSLSRVMTMRWRKPHARGPRGRLVADGAIAQFFQDAERGHMR